MTTLKVEWYEAAGDCDFCCNKMELEVRAVLTDFQVTMIDPVRRIIFVAKAPFVLCNSCQVALNLTRGELEVHYKLAQQLYCDIVTRLLTLNASISMSRN